MASPPNYNHPYPQQHPQHPPPVQTQNLNMSQRAFSPPSYQQSPVAMSPTVPGIPPAKRQRLSPNPTSPYQSPFATSPYAVTSPYATSPPANNYLSLPQSPAAGHPPPSFHQPQPYQNPHAMVPQPPSQGSMPPPKVPYSKAQDSEQLEKANPRDMDVNNISDVLTGSGIDLRAEEDNLLHNYGSRTYGNSFNSQASGSTVSPHGSFNNWNQQASHGAYQGTGPLSQSMSQEQQEAELIRKHEQAARVLHETAQQPLSDPFLFANILRHRIAKRAYENGIQVNLDGLFDKIPEQPQDVARTAVGGSNGEAIVGLQAASLLNQNTTFVEILSLLSLAAEERVRTVVEDSFALCQGRQNTSHGIVPPDLLDIAETDKDSRPATATAVNILKTSWEAPDNAVSPLTVSATKQPPNVARLPTPPSEAPPTPQPTVQVTNHVINALKRRVDVDESFEKERIRKRQKRLAGNASTPADTPTVAPLPLPEKMTKKERDRINKLGQTEDVLHRKANETASMALGGKKKYAWMSGGGGGGGGGTSGTSTPRLNTAVGTASGTQTPQQPPTDRALQARKRTFPLNLESSAIGEKIQIRDLVHVLESDGREKKTLTAILARLKNTDKDEKTKEPERRSAVPPTR